MCQHGHLSAALQSMRVSLFLCSVIYLIQGSPRTRGIELLVAFGLRWITPIWFIRNTFSGFILPYPADKPSSAAYDYFPVLVCSSAGVGALSCLGCGVKLFCVMVWGFLLTQYRAFSLGWRGAFSLASVKFSREYRAGRAVEVWEFEDQTAGIPQPRWSSGGLAQ
jgi:hypothetical protein